MTLSWSSSLPALGPNLNLLGPTARLQISLSRTFQLADTLSASRAMKISIATDNGQTVQVRVAGTLPKAGGLA
jgi:hypothetical protein